MKRAEVLVHGMSAGVLEEIKQGSEYQFTYNDGYRGPPVSLTMPVDKKSYRHTTFPPFFDGLLPEGAQLESLLRLRKIDKNDLFSQLVIVGNDLVGAVTVMELQ